jgi:hypothetical protein
MSIFASFITLRATQAISFRLELVVAPSDNEFATFLFYGRQEKKCSQLSTTALRARNLSRSRRSCALP